MLSKNIKTRSKNLAKFALNIVQIIVIIQLLRWGGLKIVVGILVGMVVMLLVLVTDNIMAKWAYIKLKDRGKNNFLDELKK